MSRLVQHWPLLAVVVAVGLALLAEGVLAAGRDAHAGVAPRGLARIGSVLVGRTDDRGLSRALTLAAAAARPGISPGAAFRQRGAAEAALTQAAQRGPATVRARASHVLAVLALKDAASDPANASSYRAAATGGFRAAARLDPNDNASKYDLELLLSLDSSKRSRQQQHPQRRPGRSGRGHARAQRGRGGSGPHASADAPGTGY